MKQTYQTKIHVGCLYTEIVHKIKFTLLDLTSILHHEKLTSNKQDSDKMGNITVLLMTAKYYFPHIFPVV